MLDCATRRLLIGGIVAALAGMLLAPVAHGDHGEGHNGETMELSKSEDLEDGEVVTVALASWLPGNTATVVTCYVYPAAGPADCELSNYGMHTVVIGEDGTGTLDYPVVMVPGRCDENTSCLVVASDGFGANANYAAQEFTFAAASAAEPEPRHRPKPPSPNPHRNQNRHRPKPPSPSRHQNQNRPSRQQHRHQNQSRPKRQQHRHPSPSRPRPQQRRLPRRLMTTAEAVQYGSGCCP